MSSTRCWGDGDPLFERYHDEEWGFPVLDERGLFEKLALETWLQQACDEQLSLGAVERHALVAGRELLRLQVQAHLDARGPGDVGPALLVATSGDGPRRYTHKRRHTRRLVTLFGPVTLTRIGYGRPGRDSIHPLDAQLQLPARCYSYELQRRLVGAAVRGPFDEAIASVVQATGVVIPKRAAEQLVIDTASDVEAFYARRSHEHDDAESAAAVLVASIDCKGIPMVKPEPAVKAVRLRKGQKRNKKKMATVGCVYGHHPFVRTPEQVVASLFDPPPPDDDVARRPRQRPQRKRVWASLLADKDTFITDVRAEMTRRDPDHTRTWVVVTDGERALQHRVGRILTADRVTLVLDLLHVLEKLWDAAHALHPEGSPAAVAWVRTRALWILQGRSGQVVKGLRQTVTKRGLRGTPRDTLLRVAGYYHRNRDRMRYHTYLANGWPIARGTVEGACKTLVRDRMERSGMRWTPTMAEAMLRLRATYLSGDLDDYYDFHVTQDQQRLHPEGLWTVVPK